MIHGSKKLQEDHYSYQYCTFSISSNFLTRITPFCVQILNKAWFELTWNCTQETLDFHYRTHNYDFYKHSLRLMFASVAKTMEGGVWVILKDRVAIHAKCPVYPYIKTPAFPEIVICWTPCRAYLWTVHIETYPAATNAYLWWGCVSARNVHLPPAAFEWWWKAEVVGSGLLTNLEDQGYLRPEHKFMN